MQIKFIFCEFYPSAWKVWISSGMIRILVLVTIFSNIVQSWKQQKDFFETRKVSLTCFQSFFTSLNFRRSLPPLSYNVLFLFYCCRVFSVYNFFITIMVCFISFNLSLEVLVDISTFKYDSNETQISGTADTVTARYSCFTVSSRWSVMSRKNWYW